MQIITFNSDKMENTSNEAFLDTLLPKEVLGVIFDQVVNQSQSLADISSILLTCQKWKDVLEENPCISLVQALFQVKMSHGSAIKLPQECIKTEQKKYFTSQELKLIDLVHSEKRFEKLLMVKSELFQLNSLFLSLLDRYPWDLETCKNSANKNIQLVAEKQLSILNSLASGTDDQILTVIKDDFIEKFYQGSRGETWQPAKTSIISTLKKFPNFNDKKLFIKVAHCFGRSVFDIHEGFKNDREIVLAAVQQNGWALQYAHESLQKDREIVLTAVQQTAWVLQFAHASLQEDRQIVLAAVKQNGWAVQYANESLQKDREIFLAAVKQYSWALQFADENLKKDREIVLAAIQQDGRSLRYADESLKKDRDIVLAAVQQNGWALQYADESLKKDREIFLAAVQQNGWALQFADENFKKDREIILAAVQQDGRALRYADESFKKDREIVLTAIKQNRLSVHYADLSLQIV